MRLSSFLYPSLLYLIIILPFPSSSLHFLPSQHLSTESKSVSPPSPLLTSVILPLSIFFSFHLRRSTFFPCISTTLLHPSSLPSRTLIRLSITHSPFHPSHLPPFTTLPVKHLSTLPFPYPFHSPAIINSSTACVQRLLLPVLPHWLRDFLHGG